VTDDWSSLLQCKHLPSYFKFISGSATLITETTEAALSVLARFCYSIVYVYYLVLFVWSKKVYAGEGCVSMTFNCLIKTSAQGEGCISRLQIVM